MGNETMPVKNKTTLWDLKEFFEEEFFETKKSSVRRVLRDS